MTQLSDVYRKVGRGGSGNYFAATGPDDKDLEAQPVAPPAESTSTAPAPAPQGVIRTGRGGAGNWQEPSKAAQNTNDDDIDVEKAAAGADSGTSDAAVRAMQQQPARRRFGGRGGAGNLQDGDEAERLQEEQQRRDEVDGRVLEEVDMGLKMPEKAHHVPRTQGKSSRD